MKTPLGLLLLGLAGGAFLFAKDRVEEKPIWHSDWPTVQRLARELNRPIFAVLSCKH